MTIKEARIKAGLTQREAEELTGVPKRTYESWEMGERTPPGYVKKLIIEKLESVGKGKP